MRMIALLVVATGCGGGESSPLPVTDPIGTFHATRTVTMSDPSPSFQFASEIDLAFTADNVTVSTSSFSTPYAVDGTIVSFDAGETWPSSEGAGAANLTYHVEIDSQGSLTGTIDGTVIYDPPGGAFDFDYSFDIDGVKTD